MEVINTLTFDALGTPTTVSVNKGILLFQVFLNGFCGDKWLGSYNTGIQNYPVYNVRHVQIGEHVHFDGGISNTTHVNVAANGEVSFLDSGGVWHNCGLLIVYPVEYYRRSYNVATGVESWIHPPYSFTATSPWLNLPRHVV